MKVISQVICRLFIVVWVQHKLAELSCSMSATVPHLWLGAFPELQAGILALSLGPALHCSPGTVIIRPHNHLPHWTGPPKSVYPMHLAWSVREFKSISCEVKFTESLGVKYLLYLVNSCNDNIAGSGASSTPVLKPFPKSQLWSFGVRWAPLALSKGKTQLFNLPEFMWQRPGHIWACTMLASLTSKLHISIFTRFLK